MKPKIWHQKLDTFNNFLKFFLEGGGFSPLPGSTTILDEKLAIDRVDKVIIFSFFGKTRHFLRIRVESR